MNSAALELQFHHIDNSTDSNFNSMRINRDVRRATRRT